MGRFQVALTCDFRDTDASVYAHYDLAPLKDDPNIAVKVLPQRDRVLAADIVGVDALLATPMSMAVTRESFPRDGRLALITRFGVGCDDVDLEAATACGVAVSAAFDGVRRPAAAATMALILALTTKLFDKHRLARLGEAGWGQRADYAGIGLIGKTLGVIGLGNIGAEVVRLATAFEMRFLAYDPYADPVLARSLGVTLVDLATLLSESDIVSVHCPLTPETKRLLDADRLARMKPTAFLVNMARGPIIDQQALAAALRLRRLAGAGLDVFEQEPPETDDAILQLDNVILSPHALSWTDECERLIGQANVAAVLDVMHGREPRGVVNGAVLQRPDWRDKTAAYAARFGSGTTKRA
jgi:phosphoglycerate dehydrogenase-like enzyme